MKKVFFAFNALESKTKILVKNICQSLLVKGFAIILSLINMPIFMDYFHESAVLGLWFTLLSMLNWILTFDFGIGNGLRNYLVVALEEKNHRKCEQLISSAYISVGMIAAGLSILTIMAVPLVDWNDICNISETVIPPEILQKTLIILLIGIWIQFVLKIINTILYAMQKSAIPNFLLLLSNASLLLATVFLDSGSPQGNLLHLAVVYVFTANFPLVAATVVVFSGKLKNIKVGFRSWDADASSGIIRLGMNFFILQLLTMLVMNTREFYITAFLGPEAVVDYQIYHKLFSVISTFFVLATTPLWSAITQASAQNDRLWIARTYKKGKLLFLAFVFVGIFVILCAQVLVDIWLGEKAIQVNTIYSIVFMLFNLEYMWITLHCHFENGLGRLTIQKLGYAVAAIALPLLASVFTSFSAVWIWVLTANVLALLPMSIMQPIYLRRILK